jgi:8-oxo-dGTP pyrophosphatase MutT (NUDIX family)
MSNPNQQIVFQGKIIEVVHEEMDGRTIEYGRRSPGTRLIIVTPDKKLLMTREYRRELDAFDTRLAGGKVFDTLIEYNSFLNSENDIVPQAQNAAAKEAREEVGIDPKEMKHFHTSKCGATFTWDLFYFVVTNYEKLDSQNLELGENIEVVEVSFEEAEKMCLDGSMQEERSALVLLRYLNRIKR